MQPEESTSSFALSMKRKKLSSFREILKFDSHPIEKREKKKKKRNPESKL